MTLSRTTSLRFKLAGLIVVASVASCSSDESDSDGGSGGASGSVDTSTGGGPGSQVGGSSATGTTGGANGLGGAGTGGSGALSGGTGGQQTGGTVGATGGTVGNTGGTVGNTGGTGGNTGGTGGNTGGTVGNTGGTGGTVGNTGGTGGNTGGTVGNTGGTVGTGGVDGTGGVTQATGGQAPTGGASGTGGDQNTGGQQATGGVGTGGTTEGTGGQESTGGTAGTGGGGFEGTMKIMALGDSTTWSTCWRGILWQQLEQSHPSQVDFVGTNSSNPCGVSGFDDDNQGAGSSLVTETVNSNPGSRSCDPSCPTRATLQSAFSSSTPDVVLMHYATNDIWNGKSTADIIAAYTTVLADLRSANPNVIMLVAQIIPMHVTDLTCSGCTCSNCATAVPDLNTAIASWAQQESTGASPVIVVDQYSGFNVDSDTKDGVHPTDSTGSQKMADNWYAALEELF